MRSLANARIADLHPLSELPHPLVQKAAEALPHGSDITNVEGPISGCTNLQLLEIKTGQWRGGVWLDPDSGVHWLVVAGLAKGGHLDWDDFYERVRRQDSAGLAASWLPQAEDVLLLKQETAARILTGWELAIQDQVRAALSTVGGGGTTHVTVRHPVREETFAEITICLTQVREADYEADEVDVDIATCRSYEGSNLSWQLALRVLISISPPEQGWDRFRNTFSTIVEPGHIPERTSLLSTLAEEGILVQSEPGRHSHYTHRKHLAGRTIEGRAVRGLCGAYFVPHQDHLALPACPHCDEAWAKLPQ